MAQPGSRARTAPGAGKTSVYNRHRRWSLDGTWEMILGRGPARAARGPGQGASPNDKNPPPRPGREALGRSRGGLSTKAASRSLAGVARSPALGAIIIGVISDLIEMLGIPALYE
jgi:hypothetical protein